MIYNPEEMLKDVVQWIEAEGRLDTWYYIKNEGEIAYIYADKERTILLGNTKCDSRIKSIEAVVSSNGYTISCRGYIENLDLREASE